MAVFVSHVSSQRHLAVALAQRLEASGCPCWYAPRDIPTGSIWDEQIAAAIRSCGHFLLVFSAKADLSPHVKRELALADKYRKPILWLRTDNTEPELLAYYLTDTQWLDWSGDPDDAAQALIATMAGDTTRINLRRRSVSRRSLLVGGGVTAAGLVGAGMWLATRPASAPAASSGAVAAASPSGSAVAKGPAAPIKVEGKPSEIVVGGGRLYVSGGDAGGISVVDLATRRQLTRIALVGRVFGLAYDPTNQYLYAADMQHRKIFAFDTTSPNFEQVHTLRVGRGEGPFRMAIDPDRSRLFVSSSTLKSKNHPQVTVRRIDVIDLKEFKAVASFPVGRNPAGMCVDNATGKVLVTSRDDNIVTLIDPGDGTHKSVRVGSHPFRCAIDPVSQLAYVANGGTKQDNESRVAVVDLRRWTVRYLSIGLHPAGIAINPATRLAYVSMAAKQGANHDEQGEVVSFKLDDPSDRHTYNTDEGTTGIAVDDTGVVYAVNQLKASITVIVPQ